MGLFSIFRKDTSLLESSVLKGCTDSHSHILAGVDDGIRTMQEALDVLALEEEAGVSEVWCTPHVMEDVPNTTAELKARFSELQSAYSGPIDLHLAAEYMLDNLFLERFRSHDLLTMDDSTVLVETSTWNPPPGLYESLSDLLRSGYRPLLAHPERYRYMAEHDYVRLRKMGVHFQLNLPSIAGYYGETAQKRGEWLLKKGWYEKTGTDCHRVSALCAQLNRKVLSRETASLLRVVVEK